MISPARFPNSPRSTGAISPLPQTARTPSAWCPRATTIHPDGFLLLSVYPPRELQKKVPPPAPTYKRTFIVGVPPRMARQAIAVPNYMINSLIACGSGAEDGVGNS